MQENSRRPADATHDDRRRHRLPTIAGADRIFVIEQGRTTKSGSHRELVARGGPYLHVLRRAIRPRGAEIAGVRSAGDGAPIKNAREGPPRVELWDIGCAPRRPRRSPPIASKTCHVVSERSHRQESECQIAGQRRRPDRARAAAAPGRWRESRATRRPRRSAPPTIPSSYQTSNASARGVCGGRISSCTPRADRLETVPGQQTRLVVQEDDVRHAQARIGRRQRTQFGVAASTPRKSARALE